MKEFSNKTILKPLWKEPIIKTISADHDLFKTLKQTVSPKHLFPHDILPNAKSVISFFIPFEEKIVESNIGGHYASKEWAEAYILTNTLITKINKKIDFLMHQKGHQTGNIPATHNFDNLTLLSNWSHRHVGYIAGLGNFGINNMLITEKGCCGRLGSIVTSYLFAPSENHISEEKCLYKINGSCKVCQTQCISNAYQGRDFNKHKCYQTCLENAEYYKKIGYADVCGKCLTGLPCSTRKPLI
ncbi:MAG: hypothetical protein A2Y41_13135 [Spirochaetes bacterium GWB1_36_13]|nr:MAG: hypothetical protein A2Y41_13135 [Spirochaetes bacterium GWB1_36_13]